MTRKAAAGLCSGVAFWGLARHQAKPSTIQLIGLSWRQEASGHPGRRKEGTKREEKTDRWHLEDMVKRTAFILGCWPCMPVGSQGTVGAELPSTSKGCSQHAEKLGWHPREYFLHSMDRLLDYTTTWTFGPAITRRITLPCLVQGDRQQERGRARCTEGQEEGAEGRHFSSSTKGQQVWVRAPMSLRSWLPRRWLPSSGDSGQADGAQAEFEAISLHEARRGPSALSHLELGVVLAVFVDKVRYRHRNLSVGQRYPRAPLVVASSGWEASAGLGWVEDVDSGAAQMPALSHTPDCLGQAVTKSACPGWSSGLEGFASGGWRWRIQPRECFCRADL